jgi:hypothetical protein
MVSYPRTGYVSREIDPHLAIIPASFKDGHVMSSQPNRSALGQAGASGEVPSRGRLTYKERRKKGIPADEAWLDEPAGFKEDDFVEKISSRLRRVKRSKQLKCSGNPTGIQHKTSKHSIASPGSNHDNNLVKRASQVFTTAMVAELLKLAGSDDPNHHYVDDDYVRQPVTAGRGTSLMLHAKDVLYKGLEDKKRRDKQSVRQISRGF